MQKNALHIAVATYKTEVLKLDRFIFILSTASNPGKISSNQFPCSVQNKRLVSKASVLQHLPLCASLSCARNAHSSLQTGSAALAAVADVYLFIFFTCESGMFTQVKLENATVAETQQE